jgi:hypothetical protein
MDSLVVKTRRQRAVMRAEEVGLMGREGKEGRRPGRRKSRCRSMCDGCVCNDELYVRGGGGSERESAKPGLVSLGVISKPEKGNELRSGDQMERRLDRCVATMR